MKDSSQGKSVSINNDTNDASPAISDEVAITSGDEFSTTLEEGKVTTQNSDEDIQERAINKLREILFDSDDMLKGNLDQTDIAVKIGEFFGKKTKPVAAEIIGKFFHRNPLDIKKTKTARKEIEVTEKNPEKIEKLKELLLGKVEDDTNYDSKNDFEKISFLTTKCIKYISDVYLFNVEEFDNQLSYDEIYNQHRKDVFSNVDSLLLGEKAQRIPGISSQDQLKGILGLNSNDHLDYRMVSEAVLLTINNYYDDADNHDKKKKFLKLVDLLLVGDKTKDLVRASQRILDQLPPLNLESLKNETLAALGIQDFDVSADSNEISSNIEAKIKAIRQDGGKGINDLADALGVNINIFNVSDEDDALLKAAEDILGLTERRLQELLLAKDHAAQILQQKLQLQEELFQQQRELFLKQEGLFQQQSKQQEKSLIQQLQEKDRLRLTIEKLKTELLEAKNLAAQQLLQQEQLQQEQLQQELQQQLLLAQQAVNLAQVKARIRAALHADGDVDNHLADDADGDAITKAVALVVNDDGDAADGHDYNHAALMRLLGDEFVGDLAAKTIVIKRILNQMDPLAVPVPAPATLAQVKDGIRAVLGNLAIDANGAVIEAAIELVMQEDGTAILGQEDARNRLANLLGPIDDADRKTTINATKRILNQMDAAAIEAVQTQVRNTLALADSANAEEITAAINKIMDENGDANGTDDVNCNRLKTLLGDDGKGDRDLANTAVKRILNQMDAAAIEAVQTQIKTSLGFADKDEINENSIKEKITNLRKADTTRGDNGGIDELANLLGVNFDDNKFTNIDEVDGLRAAAIDDALNKAAKDNLGVTIEGLEQDLAAKKALLEAKARDAIELNIPQIIDMVFGKKENENRAGETREELLENEKSIRKSLLNTTRILDENKSISNSAISKFDLRVFLAAFAGEKYNDLNLVNENIIELCKIDISGDLVQSALTKFNAAKQQQQALNQTIYKDDNPFNFPRIVEVIFGKNENSEHFSSNIDRIKTSLKKTSEIIKTGRPLTDVNTSDLGIFLATFARKEYVAWKEIHKGFRDLEALDRNTATLVVNAVKNHNDCIESALLDALTIPARSTRADSSKNVVDGRTIEARQTSHANGSFQSSSSKKNTGGSI